MLTDQPESVYQTELITALRNKGFDSGRRAISNGQPDIYVSNSEPPVLIEIKAVGDWKAVALAAAQLLIYGNDPSFRNAKKIAVFGTGILQHQDVFERMFEKLGIVIVSGGRSAGTVSN